jgi:hypothetical protein
MSANFRDGDLLRQLEEKLLSPQIRSSARELDHLIADEFVEFGASGRVYTKPIIIAELPQETPLARSLSDFAARPLGPGVALVTYTALGRQPGEPDVRSLRSSVWVLRDGRWQMLFHQGTRAPPTR